MAELVDSISEVGLLQPVVVRPLGDGRFELVMGERRWRATQAAGLPSIPAIVRETEDHDLLRDALLENLHRAQLNPLEEAAAYQQLLDRLRLHPGRAGPPDQAVPAADLQHPPPAPAAADGPAPGGRRCAQRRPCAGPARGPRHRRSGATRAAGRGRGALGPRDRGDGRPRARPAGGSGLAPDRAVGPVPEAEDVAARLSDRSGHPGPGRPRSAPRPDHHRLRSADDLERIARLIEETQEQDKRLWPDQGTARQSRSAAAAAGPAGPTSRVADRPATNDRKGIVPAKAISSSRVHSV